MAELVNFISKYTAYKIWDSDKLIARFKDIGGGRGHFSTGDPDIVKFLKNHKKLNYDFQVIEGSRLPEYKAENVNVGAQTTMNNQIDAIKKNLQQNTELEKQREMGLWKSNVAQKWKTYGILTGTLLNKEGGYRKDATPEQIEEFEKLKQELEV